MPILGDAGREYHRLYRQRRRDAWISLHGPCKVCGSNENLEVDHIDPKTKTMQPSQIWSRTETVREAELAKCQVLCAACHIVKTRNQRRKPHGYTEIYYNKGCRCEPCKEFRRNRSREQRLVKKLNY